MTPPLRLTTGIVAARDGTPLATEVLRADGRRGPVLLTRTPYGRALSRAADDLVDLAQAGWRVVVQDTRGRGDSGGTFAPYHQDIRDGADAVAWCRTQPWSDGRVAMFGGSYRGATAWLAAHAEPDGLRAIASTVSAADFGEGWTFEGGIPAQGFLEGWALRFASSGSAAVPDGAARAQRLADDGLSGPTSRRTEIGELFPPFRQWMDPSDTGYWQPLDLLRVRRPAVAGFHVAGWYDHICEGSLRTYRALADADGAPQRLVVGPWWHGGVGGPVVGEQYQGGQADAARIGLYQQQFGWLREALDGVPGLETGARVFVLGAREWRDFASWPPPAVERDVVLHRDEAPSAPVDRDEAPSAPVDRDEAPRVLVHDPRDPAPVRGGRHSSWWPPSGPYEQGSVEARPDVLVHTGPVATRDTDVVGMVRGRLTVACAAPSFDLVLRLCDVYPDGRSYNVVEHAHRLHAGGELTLDIGSTAWRWRAGHGIRLHVAGTAWPRVEPQARPFTVRVVAGPVLVLPVA